MFSEPMTRICLSLVSNFCCEPLGDYKRKNLCLLHFVFSEVATTVFQRDLNPSPTVEGELQLVYPTVVLYSDNFEIVFYSRLTVRRGTNSFEIRQLPQRA